MGSPLSNMKLFLVALSISCLAACNAQSVKSCGKAGDILANATFSVSPDPIKKGSQLTIDVAGDLTAAVTAGKSVVNLNIKALGIINEPVKLTIPFTLSPGPVAGPVTAKIGPFDLPSVPGSVDISGTVTVSDASGAQIFCTSLNVALGSAAENPMSQAIVASTGPPVVSNCGTASDHLKNITTTASGGVKTLTGTLDEAITSGSADVDLTVKVLFITVPIKTHVPFTISPGVVAGPLKVSFGPVQKNSVVDSAISIKIAGTVKASDGKAGEIACLKLS